ncbi:MAG: right-handed parallel beta-helix repeat-containing protein [Candidatus Kapaibacteriales bacterium]
MKTIFLVFLFSISISYLYAQTISEVQLNKYHIKRGENFYISITTNGTFHPDNLFKVEISDLNGDFANSTLVGSLQSRSSITIPCRIPDSFPLGTNYRLRILATSPNYSFNVNSKKIIIYRGNGIYVSMFGSDSSDGSLNAPFRTIQKAINSAWYFDTVFVMPGTYYENLNIREIPVSLVGLKGYDSTFIDGRINSQPVISIENCDVEGTLIYGFTIQNARTYEMEQGGGITIRYSPSIINLIHLRIKNNKALSYGGGLFSFNSGPINIQNCFFENNEARYFGAGIYSHNSPVNLENCIVAKNNPGGIMVYRSNLNTLNCLIYKNYSNEIIIISDLAEQLTPKVINTTIYALPGYYAYFLEGRFKAYIYNSIIYGVDSTIYVSGDAYDTLFADYNIVYKYPKTFRAKLATVNYGNNNLSDDPLFFSPINDNFDLDSCSPALGSASKEWAPPLDIFGFRRPTAPEDDELPDRGAIENPLAYRSNIVNITNVSKLLFCESEKFFVDYQTGGCSFYDGNEFIVELSNPSGTFNPSTTIGSLQSSTSGQIQCQIPPNFSPGTYKIRVRATKLPFNSKPYDQTIKVFGNPTAPIYGETKVCSKREYIYWTDSTDNPTNSWSIVNGISYNLLTENLIKVFWKDSATGKIILTQKNLAGCSGSTTKDITIFATPDKPLIQLTQGGSLVSNYPSWNQWYWNGNIIPNATGRVYTPTKDGYYSVKIIPPYGCPSDMSDSIYVLISSIEEKVFPKVSIIHFHDIDLLKIKFSEKDQIIHLTLLDYLGREIQPILYNVFEDIIELELKHLGTGPYFLLISTLSENLVYKIMKY